MGGGSAYRVMIMHLRSSSLPPLHGFACPGTTPLAPSYVRRPTRIPSHTSIQSAVGARCGGRGFPRGAGTGQEHHPAHPGIRGRGVRRGGQPARVGGRGGRVAGCRASAGAGAGRGAPLPMTECRGAGVRGRGGEAWRSSAGWDRAGLRRDVLERARVVEPCPTLALAPHGRRRTGMDWIGIGVFTLWVKFWSESGYGKAHGCAMVADGARTAKAHIRTWQWR